MTGRLLGIARHDRPRGPMETVERATVGLATGIEGDYRGSLKPGRNRRQVTAITVASWEAALAELGVAIGWEQRRINLLVDGIDLEDVRGARLHFADGVALEITGWCDPCFRMEAVAPGLEKALMPGWRSGVNMRVIAGGELVVGQEVRIER